MNMQLDAQLPFSEMTVAELCHMHVTGDSEASENPAVRSCDSAGPWIQSYSLSQHGHDATAPAEVSIMRRTSNVPASLCRQNRRFLEVRRQQEAEGNLKKVDRRYTGEDKVIVEQCKKRKKHPPKNDNKELHCTRLAQAFLCLHKFDSLTLKCGELEGRAG